MRRLPIFLALLLVSVARPGRAEQAAPAVGADGPVLDTTVVRAPGPGMWKISRGDHVMWVLGVVSPVPKDMVWNGARMRSTVAAAGAVLQGPAVTIGSDAGFFGKLSLLPSLVGIRDLPDDKKLVDVLPPPLYERWARLKRQYIGSDRASESWRPIFAAQKLNERAMDAHRLQSNKPVYEAISEAVKARGIKAVMPKATLMIKNPKDVIKDFKRTDLADIQCFERVLDRIENDVDTLSARADAWAAGDIARLRALQRPDPSETCLAAVLGGGFGARYGIDRLQAEADAKWITEAESDIATHVTTFAVLPMREVLGANGLVARLAAKGYVVESPDALPVSQPVPAMTPTR